MTPLPWHKFYVDKFMSTMHKFPNHIIGKWMRVFCTMAESKDRWTIIGNLEEWSRIVGEKSSQTREFINYVIDHFPHVKVEIKLVDNKPIYTMTDTYYKLQNGGGNYGPPPTNSMSTITYNRNLNMDKILSTYHPSKLLGKNSRFKKEYIKLMQETSRGIKKIKDRVDVENDLADQILSHINHLAASSRWHEPRLLLPLDKYIMHRAWLSPEEITDQRESTMARMIKKAEQEYPEEIKSSNSSIGKPDA